MPFILLFALFVPRVVIVVLWAFTSWFSGVFTGFLWPLIGFIGFPYALLVYSIIANTGGTPGSPLGLVAMVLAIVADIYSWWSGYGWGSGSRQEEV